MEEKQGGWLEGAFAMGALEAGLVVCDAVGHELIHGVHSLLACLAFLLRPSLPLPPAHAPIIHNISTYI